MNAHELMIGDLVTVTTPDGSRKTKTWGRREDISIYPAIEPIEITGEFLEKMDSGLSRTAQADGPVTSAERPCTSRNRKAKDPLT